MPLAAMGCKSLEESAMADLAVLGIVVVAVSGVGIAASLPILKVTRAFGWT